MASRHREKRGRVGEGETRRFLRYTYLIPSRFLPLSPSPLLLVSRTGRACAASLTKLARPSWTAFPSSGCGRTSEKDARTAPPYEDDRMSGTIHRTWQNYHVGHFLTTIQLDPVADSRTFERHADLAQVSKQLI